MADTPRNEICERIAKVRAEVAGPRGKSSFARQLGLSPSTYDYYESTRVPPAPVLVRIADLAGVDLRWLLTGKTGAQPSVAADHPVLRRAAELLSGRGDAGAPLAAFLDILAETVKFPDRPHRRAAKAEPPAADRRAEPRHEQPVAAEPAAAERREAASAKLPPATASWIPVLGRSAAGVPRFWADDAEAAGLTPLSDLVARHARSVAERIQTATASWADPAGQQRVQIITLRAPPGGEPAQFLSAAAIKALHADAFAVWIDGESMAPEICHGDLVVCSPSMPAADGRAAVVQIRKQIGVTCKLYRRADDVVHLVPINEQFQPLSVPAEKVVWALRVLARVRQ